MNKSIKSIAVSPKKLFFVDKLVFSFKNKNKFWVTAKTTKKTCFSYSRSFSQVSYYCLNKLVRFKTHKNSIYKVKRSSFKDKFTMKFFFLLYSCWVYYRTRVALLHCLKEKKDTMWVPFNKIQKIESFFNSSK